MQDPRILVELEMQARLGRSYGYRRPPRVRVRKGRPGLFRVLGENRTKRAALRAARAWRDAHPRGEAPALVVWQESRWRWKWGARRIRPCDS